MKDNLERIRDEAQRQGVQFMDVRLFEEDGTSVLVQDTKADKWRRTGFMTPVRKWIQEYPCDLP